MRKQKNRSLAAVGLKKSLLNMKIKLLSRLLIPYVQISTQQMTKYGFCTITSEVHQNCEPRAPVIVNKYPVAMGHAAKPTDRGHRTVWVATTTFGGKATSPSG